MARLRYPLLWWTLGWILIAGVIVGSLLPGGAVDVGVMSDKTVHAATYCVLMLWFSGLYRQGRGVFVVAALLLLLGVTLDVLQGLATSTRTFDLWDIAANGGGILVGLVLAWLYFAGWCERVERLFPV